MKISLNWLQTFFEEPLPSSEVLSNTLTFHAFEIDGIDTVGDDQVLDVKITANRGHDCLSHRGIAKELSAILDIPLTSDPLSGTPALPQMRDIESVHVTIDTPYCNRYIAGYIKGVKVGPSPEWLRLGLESVGQRSINNVVDATNYIMFHIGQPLHAFDASKLTQIEEKTKASPLFSIGIRQARAGEKLIAFGDMEYILNESITVITDAVSDTPIGVAGVKGGMAASITSDTTDIIIESANFEGVAVRKAASQMKIRTDASARFEQGISPELARYGMQLVSELILKIAQGEVVGFTDVYPNKQVIKSVSVTLSQIQNTLGTTPSHEDVLNVFNKLGFESTVSEDVFTVTPTFERLDILIPEDLIEEVGRIIGYDTVPALLLPPPLVSPLINQYFAVAEKKREELMLQEYNEVFTSVFVERGERVIANKVDGVRSYLRTNLTYGLTEALKKNIPNKDLLGLKKIKLFEIGTIWKEGKEEMVVATIEEGKPVLQSPLITDNAKEYEKLPLSETLRYQPFSKYPYIVRDIAMWVPKETNAQVVLESIKTKAGPLLLKIDLFDRFEKDTKISLAFRLIFQSFERTLVDEEVNEVMKIITTAIENQGFQVR